MTGELTNHLWQSTLFALAMGLLALVFRRNRARVRYWLWFSVSMKFLFPFSLLMNLGGHLAWAPVARNGAMQALSFTMAQVAQPFVQGSPSIGPGRESTNWPLIAIFIVWACGFGLIALIRFRTWLHIRAAVRASTLLPIATMVEVRSSPGLLEPGVAGLFRPVLLLPESIVDRLTPAQLDAVLAHELCHVQRRDNLTAAIHMIVEAVFWFHPLVWWVGAQLVMERERACDEEVLQLGSDAQVYAEGILTVCKLYTESTLACVAGIGGYNLRKRLGLIMRSHVGEPVNRGKQVLLAAVGVTALAVPIVIGLLSAKPSRAESQAQSLPAIATRYEVTSIKPANPANGLTMAEFRPDGFIATNISTKFLIEIAYGIEDYQLSGAPRWVSSEEYVVQGKVDDVEIDELRKLSQNQRKHKNQPMLQALLADRFKLTLHSEIKDLKAYALIIAKNGPKLQESKIGDTYANGVKTPDGHVIGAGNLYMREMGKLTGQGVTIAPVVQMLSGILGFTVLDKTGLTGSYDFTLKWTPDTSQALTENQTGTDTSPPLDSSISIFTAIQEQLGLKLESQKGPVERLVIDHIERPSEN